MEVGVTERRKFFRFETTISALCETLKDKIKTNSSIKNISKEGALIIVDKPLKAGSNVSITMDIPGDNIPIVATGSVAWQRQLKKDGKEDLYDTGIKFMELNGVDKGRLLEYIYTQWLKILDKEDRAGE